jgi:hypothetical protein
MRVADDSTGPSCLRSRPPPAAPDESPPTSVQAAGKRTWRSRVATWPSLIPTRREVRTTYQEMGAERRPEGGRGSFALWVLLGPSLAVGLALAALSLTREAVGDIVPQPALPSSTASSTTTPGVAPSTSTAPNTSSGQPTTSSGQPATSSPQATTRTVLPTPAATAPPTQPPTPTPSATPAPTTTLPLPTPTLPLPTPTLSPPTPTLPLPTLPPLALPTSTLTLPTLP